MTMKKKRIRILFGETKKLKSSSSSVVDVGKKSP